ncbi:MAG: aminoacyl-tRNA hydrolase, partial [Chthoniobacteraceae bacterium]
GNPGREYSDTRHNVGFMIVDRLAASAHSAWRSENRWKAELARVGDAWLCKPQTFMNLSGEAVAAVSGFYKIPADSTLVLLDDMALPLGKLRLRASGSAGGHNGLQSVLDHFGTDAVARLRMGIGSAEPGDAVSHVLSRFRPDEKPALDDAIARAVAAVSDAQTNGLPAAMNTFN